MPQRVQHRFDEFLAACQARRNNSGPPKPQPEFLWSQRESALKQQGDLNAIIILYSDRLSELNTLGGTTQQIQQLHLKLASCYRRKKEYSSAETHIAQANQNHFETVAQRGQLHDDQGNHNQAMEHYTQALTLNNNLYNVRLRLAELLFSHQRPHEALIHLNDILLKCQIHARAHFLRGEVHFAQHNYSAAQRDYESYLSEELSNDFASMEHARSRIKECQLIISAPQKKRPSSPELPDAKRATSSCSLAHDEPSDSGDEGDAIH
ncbi:MAG: tetratricopeptide repeat protein [Chlamydiia bacterium]|nr:tetratricopeptide repeat protein [Chlamydiia bacterium]